MSREIEERFGEAFRARFGLDVPTATLIEHFEDLEDVSAVELGRLLAGGDDYGQAWPRSN